MNLRVLFLTALAALTASAGLAQTSRISRPLPGTRASAFALVQGNALDSKNAQLANTLVRLRDARFGRIVDSQLTDRVGLFAFRNIEPGIYVVEMVAADHVTVLAASPLLSVNTGEAVSAVVRLPFQVGPYSNILASTAPSITAVTTQAAASAVMAVTTAGEPTCPTGPKQR